MSFFREKNSICFILSFRIGGYSEKNKNNVKNSEIPLEISGGNYYITAKLFAGHADFSPEGVF